MSIRHNLPSFFRCVNLTLFCLAVILAYAPVCISASKSADIQVPTYRMKEVVVTATQYETAKQDIAANITVISRDEIEKLPVSTVAEVLQYLPGVYLEFNGGLGSNATGIRIQGSERRHVAIYIDGVPLNQLANPQTDLSFIPIGNVERIEVYKGAASSAWGSALGGVVNIITKEPKPGKLISGDARISYGAFNTVKSRASLYGTKNRFGYLLSVTHDQTDGFSDHTDYQQNAVYAKVHYDIGDSGRLGFVFSDDEGQGADPLRERISFWGDSASKRTYQRLLFETGLFSNWTFSVDVHHHRFQSLIEDVYPDHREIWSDYVDETWGGGARLNYNNGGRHYFNIGIDGNTSSYEYHNLVLDSHANVDANNWAVFINDTLRIGDFSFNAGLRYDGDSTFGGALSPSLGIVYHTWGNKARIRLQVARGFSAPPASWVYDPTYGNLDLKPETALNYQLGAEIEPVKWLKFELNLFRADVDNLIRYDTMRLENIDKVVRQGVEGTISAVLPLGFSVSFSGSYVDVRNGHTDLVIQDIPRTLYTLQVTHGYKWLSHSLTGTYIDHNSLYAETVDKVFVFNYHFKLKLPVGKPHYQISLFGSVYNATDSNYIYRKVWPKPRRWAEAGVRITF